MLLRESNAFCVDDYWLITCSPEETTAYLTAARRFFLSKNLSLV